MGQLVQRGYVLNFDDDKWPIIDKKKGQLIITVKMTPNKVFSLINLLGQKYALKCENVDESTLWHLRYGHLNFHGLKLLKQKEMVLELSYISLQKKFCEGCIYGKMDKLSFLKAS